MKKINWKEIRESIREKLREDPTQTRALSHVVKFFLLMLLLTLIARGTSGATLARVELSAPSRMTIANSLLVSGTVEPRGQVAIAVPAGLTVTRILAQPGTQVLSGDRLVAFDEKELADALTRKSAQRQQLLVQLEALRDTQSASDEAVTDAQRTLERANDAWSRAKAELSAAAEALEQAKQEQNAALAALAAVPEEEEAAAEAAREAVRAAEDRVRAAETAQAAAAAAAEGAEFAVQDAQDRLDRAREDYAEAQKQAGRTNQANAASADLLQLDIDAVEAEILTLTSLQASGCQLTSTAAGTVRDMPLVQGMVTTGAEQISLTTESQGYLLTFRTTAAEAEQLQSGGIVLVVSQDKLSEQVPVFTAGPGEENAEVTFNAYVYTPGWTGEPVAVTAELSSQEYGTCVSLSAIHRDGNGCFVYVFRPKLTILGIQNVAVRVDVSVLDSDGQYAAVSGDISRDDQIISGSSKPLSNGDRVRVES